MRLSRAAVVGATVLVVVGGGYAAYAENTGSATSYRTALVTTGDVEQTLALSGTLSPAGRGDLAFTTSGTVAAVRVSVGQHVKAGQLLARLDRTSLTAAVTRAESQLASAKARLASDEDAQASAAAASSTATPSASASAHPSSRASARPSASAAPSAVSSGSPSGSDAALLSQIRQQQTAVTTGQTAASSALGDAKSALAAEQQACTATPSPSASPTADQSGQAGQVSPSDDDSSADRSACDDAIDAVQRAQAEVDEAQTALQKALDALAETLSTAAGQTDKNPSQASSASSDNPAQGQSKPTAAASDSPSAASPSSPSSGSGASGGSGASDGSGSRTVTAATLASDQANIDSARADLVTAQQSLTGAALRAPHAGTVGEVDVAKGDAASAGTTAFVVLSPGATDVDLVVTSTQVAKLKVGQVAEVTPAGASKPLQGKVSRITPVPDSNGDYPVTVTLDQDGLDLPAGGTAAVDVVVGEAAGVLTVPTSAVSNGSVAVLDGTTVTRTRVTVGVVGTTRTQISAGLKRGQQVVLADLDTAVPTGEQNNGFSRGLGGGGLGSTSFSNFGGQGPAGVVVPKG